MLTEPSGDSRNTIAINDRGDRRVIGWAVPDPRTDDPNAFVAVAWNDMFPKHDEATDLEEAQRKVAQGPIERFITGTPVDVAGHVASRYHGFYTASGPQQGAKAFTATLAREDPDGRHAIEATHRSDPTRGGWIMPDPTSTQGVDRYLAVPRSVASTLAEAEAAVRDMPINELYGSTLERVCQYIIDLPEND